MDSSDTNSESFKTETIAAIAAVVVAGVALVVAGAQVLQQYISTGPLIRLCDSWVFGPMPGGGQRVWSLRQFRFRVLYTLPQINLPANWWPDEEQTDNPELRRLEKFQDLESKQIFEGNDIQQLKRQRSLFANSALRWYSAPDDLERLYANVHPSEACWVALARMAQKKCNLQLEYTMTVGDADRCPSDMQVIPMLVSLRDVIALCFMFGMKLVAITASTGIQMSGDCGYLGSSIHPSLGLVAKFTPYKACADSEHTYDTKTKTMKQWIGRLKGLSSVGGQLLEDKELLVLERFLQSNQKKDFALVKQNVGRTAEHRDRRYSRRIRPEDRWSFEEPSSPAPLFSGSQSHGAYSQPHSERYVPRRQFRHLSRDEYDGPDLPSSSSARPDIRWRSKAVASPRRGNSPIRTETGDRGRLPMNSRSATSRRRSSAPPGPERLNVARPRTIDERAREMSVYSNSSDTDLEDRPIHRRSSTFYQEEQTHGAVGSDREFDLRNNGVTRRKARDFDDPTNGAVPPRRMDAVDRKDFQPSSRKTTFAHDVEEPTRPPRYRPQDSRYRYSVQADSPSEHRRTGGSYGEDDVTVIEEDGRIRPPRRQHTRDSSVRPEVDAFYTDRPRSRQRQRTITRDTSWPRTRRDQHGIQVPRWFPWFWYCQFDIVPGFWVNTRRIDPKGSFIVVGTMLFREVLNRICSRAGPATLQYVPWSHKSYEQPRRWLEDSQITTPPYAFNNVRIRIDMPRWDTDEVENQAFSDSHMAPIILLDHNEDDMRIPGGSHKSHNDQDLCELMYLDSWLHYAGSRTEIKRGEAELEEKTPNLVKEVMDSIQSRILKVQWPGVKAGRKAQVRGVEAGQEIRDLAAAVERGMRRDLDLSDAELMYLCVALYRAHRVAYCHQHGPDSSRLEEVFTRKPAVYLV